MLQVEKGTRMWACLLTPEKAKASRDKLDRKMSHSVLHVKVSPYFPEDSPEDPKDTSSADNKNCLLQALGPILYISYVLGISPLHIQGSSQTMSLSWTSPYTVLTVVLLVVTLSHTAFEVLVLSLCFYRGAKTWDIVATLIWCTGEFIVVGCWFFTMFKRTGINRILQGFKRLHERGSGVKVPKSFLCCIYGLYFGLTTFAAMAVAHTYYQDPGYITFWTSFFPGEDRLLYPGMVFYIWRVVVMMIAQSLVEVIMAVMAKKLQMEFQANNQRVQSLLLVYSTDRGLLPMLPSTRKMADDDFLGRSCLLGGGSHQDDFLMEGLSRHQELREVVEEIGKTFGALVLAQLGLYLVMVTSFAYVSVQTLRMRNESWPFFVGNLVNFTVRLLFLVPVYNGVHRDSSGLASLFQEAVTSLHPVTLLRVSYFAQHLQLNPVGITAGGFFTVTLSTLLTFWATTVTYLVVMFQS